MQYQTLHVNKQLKTVLILDKNTQHIISKYPVTAL